MQLGGFGRVAIVTGAANGIGLTIAKEFIRNRKRTVLLDIDSRALEEFQTEPIYQQHEEAILCIKADVSKGEDIDKSIEQVLEKWGRIDILVNNAGIRKETKIEDITHEEWNHILNINLGGTFFFSQAVLKLMKEQAWGRIINVSGYAGQFGPVTSGAHYSASKAGQLILTKVFAREVAPYGVTVNAISPAVVRSPEMERVLPEKMKKIIQSIPVGRVGEAEEVARMVNYLASESTDYITGATFDINGGMLMR